jgi:hypothetical protein
MGTNKNVVVSFSIAILLLLSLLLLLTYNSKCNQSHNTAGPAMQSSQNPYNIANYSGTPEPFYIEHFAANKPTLTTAQLNDFDRLPSIIDKKKEFNKYKSSGYDINLSICPDELLMCSIARTLPLVCLIWLILRAIPVRGLP